jgi:hypothetical protein
MRLKPWSARGGIAQSPWPLASVVGSQPHGVRGCVHVLRSIGAGMGGERAWVCGVPGGQTQSGSTAWLGWPASTRGHTCVHENGCASSRTTRRKGRAFSLPRRKVRMCVSRSTGTWVCARVRACARRGHGHGDGRDNGSDAMTGKNERWNEEERSASGAARVAKTAAAPARSDFPAWLDGRHHTACARRSGGVPGHGGELTRLDVRHRLEGQVPQQGRTERCSPTVYATRR